MPIVIIIALMIIGIFVFAWTKPNTISIQRVADIKATPEQIFELINNFRNWPAWSSSSQPIIGEASYLFSDAYTGEMTMTNIPYTATSPVAHPHQALPARRTSQ